MNGEVREIGLGHVIKKIMNKKIVFIIVISLFISGCIKNKTKIPTINNQVTPQEKKCMAENGQWKQMNYKADSCVTSVWGPAVMRSNCDCGPEKCWDGDECIDDLPVEAGHCEFLDGKESAIKYKLKEQDCPSAENIYEQCENFCYTNQKCDAKSEEVDFDIVKPRNNLFEPKCICGCISSEGWSF